MAEAAITSRHEPPLRGRVLAVDDQKSNRLKMAAALRHLGLEVQTVESGPDCLAALRAQDFDIVLLDIVMPGMDGFAVLKAIKADPALRDLPVIVISALDTIEDIVRAIEMGAEDFLTKPFDPVLLKARLGAGIERKRLRDKELEYLQQVDRLTSASALLEGKDFDPARLGLDDIARRDDPLGNMARVFLEMAAAVYRRERMLRKQISLLKGGFLLIFMGLIWGPIPALSLIVMQTGMPPLGMVFWVLACSALCLVMVSLITGRGPDISRPALRRYTVLGLFGDALPRLFLLLAATHVPAMVISVILATKSFMVFGFAAATRIEPPSFKRFAGLCLGLCCVGLIILPGGQIGGLGGWMWILLALGVPLSSSIKDIAISALPERASDPITMATGSAVAATLMMLPVTVMAGAFVPPAIAFAQSGWALFLIGALSALLSVILVFTIRTTGAVFASQASYAMTAAGIFWSVLLLGETMSVWVWAALACLVSGLALVMPKQVEEVAEARTEAHAREH